MTDTITTEEKEGLIRILHHYLRNDLCELTDFEKVIETRTPLTINNEQCYQYNCPIQTIYLNTEGYAVDYKRQHIVTLETLTNDEEVIIDETASDPSTMGKPYPTEVYDTEIKSMNAEPEDTTEVVHYSTDDIVKRNKGYYYDFNTEQEDAGTYTYINSYEWKRNSIWED